MKGMCVCAGAALFTKYIDPYGGHTVEEVLKGLDHLAETVAEHVVLSTTAGAGVGHAPFLPQARGLVDHQQMCRYISEVLFVQLGFIGNTQDYYQLSNSLIQEVFVCAHACVCVCGVCVCDPMMLSIPCVKVLRRKLGIPITLCIIYSAVARRLGVYLDPVRDPCMHCSATTDYF